MTIELEKPDTARFLRVEAMERFPDIDVVEVEPLGRLMDLEKPRLMIYSQDQYRLNDASWNEVLGYRIFAGTRADPTDARRLGTQVEAWLWSMARPDAGNPIAAVTASNGPSEVPSEHETAVLYGTVEMVIAGVYPV